MLSRHWFIFSWELSCCTRTFGFTYYRNTFSAAQWASQGSSLGLFLLSLISCFQLAHSNYLEPSGHWPSSSLPPNSRSSFHSVSPQPLINKAAWRGPRLGLCFGSKCFLKSCTGRKYSGLQHVHRLARMSPNLLLLSSGHISKEPTSSNPALKFHLTLPPPSWVHFF